MQWTRLDLVAFFEVFVTDWNVIKLTNLYVPIYFQTMYGMVTITWTN